MQIISGIQSRPLKVVLYGPEGIGKSTFASQAPAPLFIDTEGGTTWLNVNRFPQPESYTMLCQQIDYVSQNPGICRTLVLDTADWAERKVYEYVCASNKWTSIESPGYGAGYRYTYEEFGRLLNSLDRVWSRGINIIVTAHAAMRKFEQPDQMGSYDRWELKLQNSSKCNTAGMLKEWADMVLFANYDTFTVQNTEKKNRAQGGKRVMYTTHHPCWDAKNRFGLPEKLPFEFSQVARCFGEAPQSAPSALQQKQDAPAAAPVQEKTQQPVQSTNAAPNDGIPDALRQLMEAGGVTEAQIRKVVAGRGYYPEATPIKNYDPGFIEGVLIGAWGQVYEMIKGESK